MNYQHVLIITYGRSGSTLLQGLLNSIDGCIVRGENYDACKGLFRTYQALQQTKLHQGEGSMYPTSPWYGAYLVDEDRFFTDARALLLNQLSPPDNAESYKCIGFKEIRYIPMPEVLDRFIAADLHAYLDFLARLLPQCAMIDLRRDHDEVVSSAWWKAHDLLATKATLVAFEAAMNAYAKNKPWVFTIRFSDLIHRTSRLRTLFEFLGAPYIDGQVSNVLSTKHSYSLKPDKDSATSVCWLDLKHLDMVEHAFFDRGKILAKAGESFSTGGVVVLKPEMIPGFSLIANAPDGEIDVKWGLPSPKMAGKFPDNPHSQKARFRIEGVLPLNGQSVDIYLVDNENNRHCLATIGAVDE